MLSSLHRRCMCETLRMLQMKNSFAWFNKDVYHYLWFHITTEEADLFWSIPFTCERAYLCEKNSCQTRFYAFFFSRSVIAASMQEYGTHTCIRWVPKNDNHISYVYIMPDRGCYSMVGRTGDILMLISVPRY